MNPFETDADVYDEWFERHDAAYRSELAAVRAALDALAPCGRGLDIGAGTGRFAAPLGIADGVEPAAAIRELAEKMSVADPVFPGCERGGFAVLTGIKGGGLA